MLLRNTTLSLQIDGTGLLSFRTLWTASNKSPERSWLSTAMRMKRLEVAQFHVHFKQKWNIDNDVRIEPSRFDYIDEEAGKRKVADNLWTGASRLRTR